MLIHAEGTNRGDAPVRLYHIDPTTGSIFIGDSKARVMVTPSEARKLVELLTAELNRNGVNHENS